MILASGYRRHAALGMKKKKERRVYLPRVLGSGQVMMPADLKRLYAFLARCGVAASGGN
jgi:hypothetical protein